MGKYSVPATFIGQKKPATPATFPKTDWSQLVDDRVDVVAAMWEHAGVDVRKKGSHKQLNGKCPYPDCVSKEDGFIVWPDRSPKTKNHYHCRRCDRSGDIIHLLQDLNGWDFSTTIDKLGLADETPIVRKQPTLTPAQKLQKEREEKALQQLEWLRHEYECGRMEEALAKYERPKRYLADRGISLEDAAKYGLGYIPAPQENGNPPHAEMWRWQGRIIFPLYGPDGLTFAGRTLALWKDGMSPGEHKKTIEEYNASHPKRVTRVMKTSPCGHFGYNGVTEGIRSIVLCEGEFDALSLALSGIDGAIAVGTAGFPASLIPLSVAEVVIALDADQPGRDAVQRVIFDMERAGLITHQVLPPSGKDWNDMYASGKSDEIYNLLASSEEPEVEQDIIPCSVCRQESTDYDMAGKPYCPTCYAKLSYSLRCDEQSVAVKEQVSRELAIQFQDDHPGQALPTNLIDLAASFKADGWNVVIEPRAPHWVVPEPVKDYWTRTREKLARSGYYEQFERENRLLEERVRAYRERCGLEKQLEDSTS